MRNELCWQKWEGRRMEMGRRESRHKERAMSRRGEAENKLVLKANPESERKKQK